MTLPRRVTAPGGETYEVIPVQIGCDSCEEPYAYLDDGTDADLEDLVILRRVVVEEADPGPIGTVDG